MAESSGRGHAVAGNLSRSPSTDNRSPEIAGDNGSTYEECKSAAHFIKEWLPFCEEELKLTQGLQFANLEECEKFYKSYAHHVGFSVRKSSFKKSKEGSDPDKLTLLGKRIQNIVKELKELDGGTSDSKISEFESFIGSSVPERIDILPPKQCHTKGSGKRLKGGKEKSMEQHQKKQRLCKACGQHSYHNSRNCPAKLSS
ncbi:hypothetical protein Cgig2_027494 [Carnegiea gigantea]|uniref:Uncharacterized protein n=1 Tax=Carnegiea gigantea TaxID=171969 RepID=A0A9Q1QLC0_9CARY|nr:hypothetical protein Cgig2_027494 [Carnegiea gigantea]